MSDELSPGSRDLTSAGMDPLELAAVRARLAAAGLVVVEADRLAELERAAAALQRMRRLAVGDDGPVS